MTWAAIAGVRHMLTRGVVAGALLFGIAMGVAVPAVAMPALTGGSIAPIPLEPPFGPPTGPDDDSCISQPADPVCGGGPYALPSPPTISMPSPAMDGGMPGIAGIGGMPGQI